MVKKIDFTTSIDVFEQKHELPAEYHKLLTAAEVCLENAYAPYSKFQVGAALLLDDGIIVTGTNQENAAYPSGMCAERTAFYWAGANHPDKKIKAAAVAARPEGQKAFVPITPCGACRQAMSEYETKQDARIPLIMAGEEKGHVWVTASIADLLPIQFSSNHIRRNPTA